MESANTESRTFTARNSEYAKLAAAGYAANKVANSSAARNAAAGYGAPAAGGGVNYQATNAGYAVAQGGGAYVNQAVGGGYVNPVQGGGYVNVVPVAVQAPQPTPTFAPNKELLESEKKKFVRYEEGAKLYSMSRNTFMKIAKDGSACYKIGKLVLINTELFEKYLETFRVLADDWHHM